MKKLQSVTKVLAIVLIALIAFIGIYTQEQNRMENRVKDYQLGMNLTGARIITLKVNGETKEIIKDSEGNVVEEEDKQEGVNYTTEEQPINSNDILTVENYNKTKKLLESRLDKFGVDDYIIKLEEETGNLIIEVPENDETDHIVSNISQVGKFEIVDSESKAVLMDNNDIKKANVLYNTTQSGTIVYLNIEFNKDGANKLKEISTEYKTVEDNTADETDESVTDETTDENTTNETEETKQRKITMQIDGSEMITTSFDETMENGSIQLSMGTATTDEEKLNESIKSASTISTLLDTGNLPIEYTIDSNEYIAESYTSDMQTKLLVLAVAIGIIALIILIVKYKKAGLISSIAFIGMVAIYLLLIRYTNVTLTLEGISAIALVIVLNYIFNYKLLSKIKENKEEIKDEIKDTYKDFFIKIIPICILSIVFCFISWTPISSFGTAMFWGLSLMALYNILVARNLLKYLGNK